MDILDLNLNLIKSFYAVCKTRSFSLASEMLYVSQPAISYNIKCLEEYFNTTLFVRNRKKITLTKTAEELSQCVEKTLNSLSDCKEIIYNIEKLDAGVINIGIQAHVFSFMSDRINNFIKNYPSIKLKIFSHSTAALLSLLSSGQIDLIIDIPPIIYDAKHFLMQKLKDELLCFACSKDFYDIKDKNLKQLLATEKVIMPQKFSSIRILMEERLQKHNIFIDPYMEVNASNVLIGLTLNNKLISLTFESIAKEHGQLQILEIDDFSIKVDVCCLTNRFEKNKNILEFINFLKEV